MKAERSGVIADILAGRASRHGVALLLRNLLPVYQMLDTSSFCLPGLARSAAIEADLRLLAAGAALPLLAEGAAYTEQVRRAAEGDGPGVIAHAYVRYLGDLNGGQIIGRRLTDCLGDLAKELTFPSYPMLPDRIAFCRAYRAELDRAVRAVGSEPVVREAMAAFEANIALSEAVARLAVT